MKKGKTSIRTFLVHSYVVTISNNDSSFPQILIYTLNFGKYSNFIRWIAQKILLKHVTLIWSWSILIRFSLVALCDYLLHYPSKALVTHNKIYNFWDKKTFLSHKYIEMYWGKLAWSHAIDKIKCCDVTLIQDFEQHGLRQSL